MGVLRQVNIYMKIQENDDINMIYVARSKKGSFSSSSGSETPRIKEERFAGARFTSPPSPDAVPLPPLSWFNQSKTIDIKHMLNIDQWEHKGTGLLMTHTLNLSMDSCMFLYENQLKE